MKIEKIEFILNSGSGTKIDDLVNLFISSPFNRIKTKPKPKKKNSSRNDYRPFKNRVKNVIINGKKMEYQCVLCGEYQRFSSGMNYHIKQKHHNHISQT